MKKDILMIAHFTSDFNKGENNRFNYIAEKISEEKADIELLTSNYSHTTKKKRTLKGLSSINYKVTMIEEPSYKKNVGLKRLYSHYIFAKNIRKYLNERKKPDVIYCAIPSISLGYEVVKYAKSRGIKIIIDVQDLWPEAFRMIMNIPIITDLILSPMEKKANFIYDNADEIVAVSNTFLKRALKNNEKAKGYSVFLGTSLKQVDKALQLQKSERKPDDEFWIAYVGTLGSSYDLISVIDSIQLLRKEEVKNIRLIVMGSGPFLEKFRSYSNVTNVTVDFMGRINYNDMIKKLSLCDIAVNPIRQGSAASIINKVGDYAATSLPVVNTQDNKEYRELLIEYSAGLNTKDDSPESLSKEILRLYKSKKMRANMSLNSRKLAEEKFNRDITYKEIISLLLEQ